MPHKRNPVLTENLTGLARMVRRRCHAGAGECGALARARHLPFLGRALHRPGRDDHARFRARPADRRDRQARRLSGADAGAISTAWAASSIRSGCCSALTQAGVSREDAYAHGPAQRDEGLGIGRKAIAARAAQGRSRGEGAAVRGRDRGAGSTSAIISSMSTRSSRGCSGRLESQRFTAIRSMHTLCTTHAQRICREMRGRSTSLTSGASSAASQILARMAARSGHWKIAPTAFAGLGPRLTGSGDRQRG